MFSQVCLFTGGLGFYGPMSFQGVDVSGTRSLPGGTPRVGTPPQDTWYMGYGWQAGGMYPTGVLSCYI